MERDWHAFPVLLTFLEVAAHLLKYLTQVSVTCMDSTLKAELWETGSYNRYVKESEKAKVQILYLGSDATILSCI